MLTMKQLKLQVREVCKINYKTNVNMETAVSSSDVCVLVYLLC